MTDMTPEDLAGRIAALSPAKRAMLEAMLRGSPTDTTAGRPLPAAIGRRADRSAAPLSFAQQRLWFLDQLEPGSPMYTMARRIRVEGQLNDAALERAFQALIARHESLRTTFHSVNGEPSQVVAPPGGFRMAFTDLTVHPQEDRDRAAQRISLEESRRPFDLAQGPLLRVRLLRLAPDEHVLVLVLHHIISDGWSMGVLMRELGALYSACVAGGEVDLPELPIQYTDYAAWQRDWLQGPVLAGELNYWKRQLGAEVPPIDLPRRRSEPEASEPAGVALPIVVPAELTKQLEELSRREKATLYMTVLAAFQCLLHRYSAQDDIVVGSPIAGRTRAELEDLIGFFINTLVLRTDLSGDPPFRQLLARTREVALEAYAHQDLPFERLVQELHPERDPDRNPLFQVAFVLQNAPRALVELPGLKLILFKPETVTSKFDLTLDLSQTPAGLEGVLAYSTRNFDAATIQRLARHFHALLEGIVANPDTRLSALPLMPPDQERAIVTAWNAAGGARPAEPDAHRGFERQAARSPHAPAVIADGGSLSYEELDRWASGLAHRLRALGVGADARVGLVARRSPELLAGILGILKAGGAYVPLDPAYPVDRLEYMLRDAGVRALVIEEGLAETEPFATLGRTLPIVPVSSRRKLDAGTGPAAAPEARSSGDELAYVMYTSGSTGTPKAVGVPHSALANFAGAAAATYGLGPSDRVLQFASISFDMSVDEIFPAWDSGAAVVLAPDGPLSPGEVSSTISRHGVTVVSLPTAFWHYWVQELQASRTPLPPTLRLVIVGGEKVQPTAYSAWRELETSHIRWVNTYGPTEATVEATAWEATPGDPLVPAEVGPPLGRPVAGATTYVLDRHLNPVPPGVKGELYIAGPGVARGYLNRPGQTAAAFVPDPFTRRAGARMYRSGDLVRYREDGNLEFVGRADGQVKIRGFRVELAEVESVLGRHPEVAASAVVAREDVPLELRLVAYVAAAGTRAPTPEELRTFLADRLPSYMLPSVVVVLPVLPLTRTGKIDRRALPPPEDVSASGADREPATETEAAVAAIWQAVLRKERVGATENFFELGGHSLLATQVIARIRSQLGVDLPLRVLFEQPTVEALAQAVDAQPKGIQPSDLDRWLDKLGEGGMS
ncbi:MAG TPA: amino acid adenylation domain-containing protein [Gemmatimonadales bacterium]|nr:amino acid adenylation domain-containing protein [Gemmatimonadales bacterium]